MVAHLAGGEGGLASRGRGKPRAPRQRLAVEGSHTRQDSVLGRVLVGRVPRREPPSSDGGLRSSHRQTNLANIMDDVVRQYLKQIGARGGKTAHEKGTLYRMDSAASKRANAARWGKRMKKRT